MKFGGKQLKNPTPASIGRAVTIISVVCGILQGYVMTAGYIPSYIGEGITGFLGLAIAISNGLKPFFGVESDRKTIPADQVTEVVVKKDDEQ